VLALLKWTCSGMMLILGDDAWGRTISHTEAEIVSIDLFKIQEEFTRCELSSKEIAEVTFELTAYVTEMSKTSEEIIALFKRNQLSRELTIKLLTPRRKDIAASKFIMATVPQIH
jgi:hypothetical protein